MSVFDISIDKDILVGDICDIDFSCVYLNRRILDRICYIFNTDILDNFKDIKELPLESFSPLIVENIVKGSCEDKKLVVGSTPHHEGLYYRFELYYENEDECLYDLLAKFDIIFEREDLFNLFRSKESNRMLI